MIEENQPRWLAFLNGEHDCSSGCRRSSSTGRAGRRARAHTSRSAGVRMVQEIQRSDHATPTSTSRTRWSAATTPQQVALRRAISLAYNEPDEIASCARTRRSRRRADPAGRERLRPAASQPHGRVQPREGQGAARHVRLRRPRRRRLPRAPRRLAARDRARLAHRLASAQPTTSSGSAAWTTIGIRITFHKGRWPELLKESLASKLQMWSLSWSAQIPDGDTFMGMFYGPNSGKSNDARMRIAGYDRSTRRAA